VKDELNRFRLRNKRIRELTNGHRPKVSVIIPTYNRPELLPRAVASVYNQTMNDQELIVVGDGTDEKSVAYMVWQMKEVPGVRFFNLPHYKYPEDHSQAWPIIGLAAINFGLDKAIGEWIAVLGDDDEFTPNHNKTLLDAAARTGAQHVYGISETYKNGRPTGQLYGSYPPGDAAFCNGANLYQADLNYRYDLRCMVDRGLTGDADLWIRMREDGVKFHFEKEHVHKYHRNWP
jgi:glycosyltransferase involved in cell wall biosynthesis